MKRVLFLFVLMALCMSHIQAQWTDSGNFLTTSDSVGIGTSDPRSKLEVKTGHSSGNILNLVSGAGLSDGGEYRWSVRIGRHFDYPNRTLDFGMVSSNYGQNPGFYVAPKGVEVFKVTSTGVTQASAFRGSETNTAYNQFIRDGGGSAVYINQVNATHPILRLSSGTAQPDVDVKFTVENNGNVGIGINNPAQKLHVVGTTLSTTYRSQPDNADYHQFTRSGGGAAVYISQISTEPHHPILRLSSGTSDPNVNVRFTVENNGNVGIGTTTPDSELTVKGTIHTQEVKVDLNGAVAPDFVFEEGYALPGLAETAAYIKTNKHLPGIPSAAEMEENGLDLKEMNLMLLQKVEELTLHLIEMKRENEEQKELNQLQQEQLDALAGKSGR